MEIETTPRTSSIRRYLGLLLKLAFTLTALIFVLRKVGWDNIATHFWEINPLLLLVAFVVLNLSQIISGMRMRYYFASAGHSFNRKFCIALYYVGALFNIILPGGISGDGYKAWLLKQKMKIRLRTSIRLMLSERANGLFLLFLYALLFAVLGIAASHISHGYILLLAAFILLLPSYFISIRLILREHFRTALGASRFSILSQGAIAISATLLLYGIGIEQNMMDYLALFMVSCVISVIPLSIGGAGMRELTFFYGAPLLGLAQEPGIAMALLFFVIQVSTSLVGLFFWHRIKHFMPHAA